MATSFHKVNNNAASTLNAAIDDNDLSLAVPTGEGAEFDTVAQYLTLGRSDTYNGEILDVASRSSDTFTVTTRGVDGTTATAHDAGDAVECLLVAAHITEIQDAINAIENGTVTLAKVITSGTAANTHTIADSATNTVVSALELYHMTSGTPASGLGAKLLLGAEDSNGDATAAIELHGYLSTVTNSSEQGVFLLRLMNAGALQDAFSVTAAANTTSLVAAQTTLNLFNTVATAVNAFGAATATAIGSTADNAYVSFASLKMLVVNSSTNAVQGERANMRVQNATSDGASGLTLRMEMTGAAAATKAIQFYRLSPAATGATTVTVFVPNTSTVAFEVDAKTGNTTVAGTVTAASDTDSTHILGRARIHSATSDRAMFAHFDRSASNQYAISHFAGGDLQVNGASSIAFQIAATTEMTLSATDLTFSDAFNLIFNATTGTKFATATSQKIGFWNATPIIQPASANQAALSLDVDVTGGDTVDKAAINTNFTNIQTLVNQLRSDLVAAGLIKGAA